MFAFMARAALGGGPNLVATVLLCVLAELVASGVVLGSRLMLILANTTGENKCNPVIGVLPGRFVSDIQNWCVSDWCVLPVCTGVLAWLVFWDVFEEAGFFSMLKGHTYNELDQSFRTLIVAMLQYAIYTVSELARLICRLLQGYGVRPTIVLPHLWGISDLILPHMHLPLGGYATSQHGDGHHEFRLKKDNKGDVRLHMRKSSKASGWVPEGPGYLVFKSSPPPFSDIIPAPFKPDSKWKRAEVETCLRQWFPYMALSEVQREAAKAEWLEKCFSLPPDMSVDSLSADQRLPVPDLPRNVWKQRRVSANQVKNTSVRLENPVVDSTHGYGRTMHTVDVETAEYRQHVREGGSTGPVPVFQSDFLFVQLQGVPLALHTVCNGALLEAAEEEDLTFTTAEYVHSPNPDTPGFWGTFSKKENSRYDPKDAKSGLKFTRHNGVERKSIVVYNVQVTKVGKELRVDASSLRELSRARPDEFPWPDTLPSTHRDASRY